MTKSEHPDSGPDPHRCFPLKEVRGVDDFLVWLMPTITVMRRYVMGSWLLKFMLMILFILIIGRVNQNTNQGREAICQVVLYAEAQGDNVAAGDPNSKPPRAPNPKGAAELYKLAANMRSTGVKCPPQKHEPAIAPVG